jgi:PadR family transcriptional regulator PadR
MSRFEIFIATSMFVVVVFDMDAPTTAKAALLQVLISGEGYGLDLIDRVRERTDGRLSLGQGSAYPALRELEKDGLVTSYEGPPLPERGGRPRRYYRITAKGRRIAYEHRSIAQGVFTLVPLEGDR